MRFFDVQQGSEEWMKLRKGILTASRCDKIITPKTRKYSSQAQSLIYELIGESLSIYGPERQESYTTNSMRFGQLCEDEARRWLALERQLEITNGGFALSDDGRFGASVDGFVGDDGAIEIKVPLPKTHVEYLVGGTAPDCYLPQIHCQLIVTGRKWIDFLSYSPGLPPLLFRVVPNDFTDDLRIVLERFWMDYQAALAKVKGL